MLPFQTISHGSATLSYFLSDPRPEILIASGFHGDEQESIAPLTELVTAFKDQLPPFLFIPQASPSAVMQKTRTNYNHADINRSYFLNSPDDEVQAMITLLEPFTFTSVFSIHEDPEQTAFYLYDIGQPFDKTRIHTLFGHMKTSDIHLFTGIDDENDATLGLAVTNGYVSTASVRPHDPIEYGFFNEYLGSLGKLQHYLCPEVPGLLPLDKKRTVVKHVIQDLMFK